jgi:hypothetical protein
VANNRRKSAAIALAVIGIAGLSLASASTLGIGTGTLQAGTQNLTDCQSGDVQANVASGGWSDTAGAFLAGAVTVSGVDVASPNDCTGKTMDVQLLDASNHSLADLGTWTIDGASHPFGAPTGVDAAAVKGVAIVISD